MPSRPKSKLEWVVRGLVVGAFLPFYVFMRGFFGSEMADDALDAVEG